MSFWVSIFVQKAPKCLCSEWPDEVFGDQCALRWSVSSTLGYWSLVQWFPSRSVCVCVCVCACVCVCVCVCDIRLQYANVCLWCNMSGHNMSDCMRRAPVIATENTAAISELKSEMGTLQKAISEVQEAQRDLPDIRRRLQNIETWQNTTQAELDTTKHTATQASQQASAAVPLSRFNTWLQNDFGLALARDTKVESTAAAALPESRFDAYVRNDFQATLDRLSVTEQSSAQALKVASFNDWLRRFQAQEDPWTPLPAVPATLPGVMSSTSSAALPPPASPTTAPPSTAPSPAPSPGNSSGSTRGDAVLQANTGVKRGVTEREEDESASQRRTRARSSNPNQQPAVACNWQGLREPLTS